MASAPLEERADVVIIGGGIVGCASAYYLARRKVRVVLLEKGAIGGEQSSRAWGFVRQQDRDPAELPWMVAGNRLWRELEGELGAGMDWNPGGLLALARTAEDLAHYEERAVLERDAGADSRMVSPAQAAALLPQLAGPVLGGLHTPSDGHADPTKSTLAFAAAAQGLGATLRHHCAVEGFTLQAGRIAGVRISDGKGVEGEIATERVLCAAGAHAAVLGRMLGLNLPVRSVRSTVAETEPVPRFTDLAVRGLDVAFRQTPTGSLVLGRVSANSADHDLTLESFRNLGWFLPNFFKNRDLVRVHLGRPLLADIARALPGSNARRHPFAHTVDVEPPPNPKSVEFSRRALMRHFPSLGEIRIARSWAGIIDTLPDILPVLGETPVPGFHFATGFSGHGFAMGPIVGQQMALLLSEGSATIDMAPLRFSRFAEGKVGKARKLR